MGRYARVKRPAALVTVALVTPVASFLASALAAGMAPPLGSLTVPVTVAVFTCPESAPVDRMQSAKNEVREGIRIGLFSSEQAICNDYISSDQGSAGRTFCPSWDRD